MLAQRGGSGGGGGGGAAVMGRFEAAVMAMELVRVAAVVVVEVTPRFVVGMR